MKITASVKSSFQSFTANVGTDGFEQPLNIPIHSSGYGSAINGGELLLSAMAIGYCNEIYLEAKKRKINISSMEVTCAGSFSEGKPADQLRYNVLIEADARAEEIGDLILKIDEKAVVHLTLRRANTIEFEDFIDDHD
jgi:uncharacterized OsmC-like protein